MAVVQLLTVAAVAGPVLGLLAYIADRWSA